MTYAANSNVQTADYNSLLGNTASPGAVLPTLSNHGEGLTVQGDLVTKQVPSTIITWNSAKSNLAISPGQIKYFEVTIESAGAAAGSNNIMIGIGNATAPITNYPGIDTNGWGYNNNGGSPNTQNYYRNGSPTSYGTGTFVQGDVIGVLVNLVALTLTFYKNNVSQGAISITSGTYYPMVGLYTAGNSVSVNTGQRDFVYSIPGGGSALAPTSAGQLGSIFNTGYGDWGYGQTVPALAQISGTGNVTVGAWYDLENSITKTISHQGVSQTLNPPLGDFVSNANIKAYTAPANTVYSLQRTIAALAKYRNTAAVGAMTVYLPTSYGVRLTRTGTWGSGSTNGIYCEARYDFTSEENARFFFNTGGELRISMSHPNTSNPQNSDWNSILAAIGTVRFAANGSKVTGTKGTAFGNGYFQLTTTAKTIYSGINIGSGAYSANDVTITAKSLQSGGGNGGTGYQIVIRINIADQHTNAYSDTVQAGTIGDFGFYKATTYLNGIVSPTVTQQTAWTTYTA